VLERIIGAALCGFAKTITGVRSLWSVSPLLTRQRIYFANHTSHGDFILIWSSLPPHLRRQTRAVAAADYWQGAIRDYVARRVFNCVLIDRSFHSRSQNPVEQMNTALAAGDSLIFFPEGTRNTGDCIQPFKSGIHHLAKSNPDVELMPVWIENLGRVLPKGSILPVPLLCSLHFGHPLHLKPEETKDEFLARAQEALLALAVADN
jgi:1-acyl-sn-glycerol-3-phosphate acyltransferase